MHLNDYYKYFNLSYDQFITQNNIGSDQIHEDLRYEKITNVSRVDRATNEFFFFRDGKLKMIYISDDVLTKDIWTEFKRITNTETPDKIVRSRAGKTSNQLIFAGHGITVSVTREVADFIEIYPSCTLIEYLENIYHEPQPFIR